MCVLKTVLENKKNSKGETNDDFRLTHSVNTFWCYYYYYGFSHWRYVNTYTYILRTYFRYEYLLKGKSQPIHFHHCSGGSRSLRDMILIIILLLFIILPEITSILRLFIIWIDDIYRWIWDFSMIFDDLLSSQFWFSACTRLMFWLELSIL